MSDKIIYQYAYHYFLPEELHQDADALIDWLASTPSHKRDWSDLNVRKPEFFCSTKGESDGICS